jgi:uncharacterized protein YndB with AHSA1/START domain
VTPADILEVSVHIAAQSETVFPYFTDPARYVQWMGNEAVLEPVPGGAYRVLMRERVEASGEFVEVDPPHRLVFTWGWTSDPGVPSGSTRVVLTLEAHDGGTLVVLRHDGLPDEEQRSHHGEGWRVYLGRLAQRVAGQDPGPNPTGEARSES